MNKIGDIIRLSEFSFINKEGKLARSDWRHNEVFPEEANFVITSIEERVGLGYDGTCSPDLDNIALLEYLNSLCEKEEDGSFVCYWQESDIVEIY